MVKNTPQQPISMRKIPKQDRAKVTIEAILEAATRLLETASLDAMTTNHIAKRAGVSIGTLYQYFPNKTAVLKALADRRREATLEAVAERLADLKGGTIDEVTRQIIQALISYFSRSGRNKQMAILIMTMRLEGPRDGLPIDGIAKLIANKLNAFADIQETQSEVALFVLTRAVMTTIRSAVVDAPHLLKEQEFEDQLVRLAVRFLQAP